MKTLITVLALFLFPALVEAHILGWNYKAGSDPHSGFRIYRKKSSESSYHQIATVGAGTRAYTDPDRTVRNCYQLAAYNQFGQTSRRTTCANPPSGTFSDFTAK